MKDSIEVLRKYSEELQIDIEPDSLKKFELYLKYLVEYNKHTNLTAIREPGLIMIKHFLDCLMVTKSIKISSQDKIIDIGTGAGFPGVPVKIQCHEADITLVDSREKKIKFLKDLLKILSIEAEIVYDRAENVGKDKKYREQFNVVLSRAVASLNILCEYCLPFVKVGGVFISMKGPGVEEELKNAKNAIHKLGSLIEKVEKFELPDGNGKRSILTIRKIKNMSQEYPRSSSKIAKRPL